MVKQILNIFSLLKEMKLKYNYTIYQGAYRHSPSGKFKYSGKNIANVLSDNLQLYQLNKKKWLEVETDPYFVFIDHQSKNLLLVDKNNKTIHEILPRPDLSLLSAPESINKLACIIDETAIQIKLVGGYHKYDKRSQISQRSINFTRNYAKVTSLGGINCKSFIYRPQLTPTTLVKQYILRLNVSSNSQPLIDLIINNNRSNTSIGVAQLPEQITDQVNNFSELYQLVNTLTSMTERLDQKISQSIAPPPDLQGTIDTIGISITQAQGQVEQLTETMNNHLNTIGNIQNNVLDGQKRVAELNGLIDSHLEDIADLQETVTYIHESMDTHMEDISNLHDAIINTNDQINIIGKTHKLMTKQVKVDNPIIEKYRHNISDIQEDITNSGKEISALQDTIDDNLKDISNLHDAIVHTTQESAPKRMTIIKTVMGPIGGELNIPADPNLDIGPGTDGVVILCTGSLFSIYRKETMALVSSISGKDFYHLENGDVHYSRVKFDWYSDVFYIISSFRKNNNTYAMGIAISKSNLPVDFSSDHWDWYLFEDHKNVMLTNLSFTIQADIVVVAGRISDNFLLYPYSMPNIIGTKVRILPKNNLHNYQDIDISTARDIRVVNNHHDDDSLYIISNEGTQLKIFTIDRLDLSVKPITTINREILEGTIGMAPQKDSDNQINIQLNMITDAVYRNGFIYCCSTILNDTGTSDIGWWKIHPTRQIVASGVISELNSWCFNGSLSINNLDKLIVHYSITSADRYIGMKIACDSVIKNIEYISEEQNNPYQFPLSAAVPWGASSTAIDPDDEMMVIVVNQLPYKTEQHYCFWSTELAKILIH